MGNEMPKKFRIVEPKSSKIPKKITLLIAIFRARDRYAAGDRSPTSPRNTNAEPKGLMRGSRALKAIRNEFQSCNQASSKNHPSCYSCCEMSKIYKVTVSTEAFLRVVRL